MSNFEVIDSSLIYKGKAFSFYSDKIKFNGKVMVKDYVLYPEAVAIIPFLGDDKFILIKQFRYSVKEDIFEIPAGKLEIGEDVLEGAVRELEEETGYKANKVRKIYEYYPAVGYSSEKIHIVFAEDLEETVKNLDEDEFTDVHVFSYRDIVSMIMENKIKDAKTVLAFLLISKLGGFHEV
ncbi:MAG: NUDIX hydrolase [Brevinematia bacterium]